MKCNYKLKYLILKRKYDNIVKEIDFIKSCKPDLKNKSDIEIIQYVCNVTSSEGFP